MTHTSRILHLFIAAALFSACTKLSTQSQKNDNATPTAGFVQSLFQRGIFLDWHEINEGMWIQHIPYTFESSEYHVQIIRIEQAKYNFSLSYNQEGFTLKQAQADADEIVMNAGFFKDGNDPVGLLYIGGERIDDHRISPDGTGMVVIADQVSLRDLSEQSLGAEETFENALQAYPVLISQGKVTVSTQLTDQARRSAMGDDSQGNIYLITSAYPYLGLSDFSRLLSQSSVPLQTVINLDGGGSTGILINTPDYKDLIDTQTLVPTVLKVRGR